MTTTSSFSSHKRASSECSLSSAEPSFRTDEFHGLILLRVLHLNNNLIAELSGILFKDLRELMTLSLYNNPVNLLKYHYRFGWFSVQMQIQSIQRYYETEGYSVARIKSPAKV